MLAIGRVRILMTTLITPPMTNSAAAKSTKPIFRDETLLKINHLRLNCSYVPHLD